MPPASRMQLAASAGVRQMQHARIKGGANFISYESSAALLTHSVRLHHKQA